MKKKTQQNHNRKKIIFQILFDLNFQQKQFFNECINISDITWLNSKLRKKNNHSSKHGVLFLDSRNWQLEWMQCFSLFFHNLILVFLVLQKKKGSAGNKNMLPQNMPLWHKDYFELKATESRCQKGSLSTHCLPKSRFRLFITRDSLSAQEYNSHNKPY